MLRKARAGSRKGRKTLRHHALGGPDSRSPQLRACGTQSHSVSKPSPGLVERVQGQGQHGRGFDRSHGRAGRKTVGGTPLGVPNTRRGQPGRLVFRGVSGGVQKGVLFLVRCHLTSVGKGLGN